MVFLCIETKIKQLKTRRNAVADSRYWRWWRKNASSSGLTWKQENTLRQKGCRQTYSLFFISRL